MTFASARAALLLAFVTVAPALHAACEPDGTQSSGAKYRICMPDGAWNGILIVFAHGYVDFTKPIAIPEDQLTLSDGTSVPGIINSLGFAFAVSSYSKNGLAIKEGINDLVDLVAIFRRSHRTDKVYLIGPSEGGIVTALSIEKFPNVYNAGIAACGPIGNFQAQINYLGNFRVLFDYFFPGVIPGSAIDVPAEVITNWDSVYVPKIKAAIAANPSAAQEVLKTSTAATDPGDPTSIENTFVTVLWYSAFTTNDAKTKLGGQPFNNKTTLYFGSKNDIALNFLVKRYSADPAAVAEMNANYETTGLLSRTLVTMHTTGDQIIPYSHESMYWFKLLQKGSLFMHANIPVFRYGHCQFNIVEAVLALGVMVLKESGQPMPASMLNGLPPEQRTEILRQTAPSGVTQ